MELQIDSYLYLFILLAAKNTKNRIGFYAFVRNNVLPFSFN